MQRAYLEARAAVRRALVGWLGGAEARPPAGAGMQAGAAAPAVEKRAAARSGEGSLPLVLVGLSGGADSLALAAALAAEAGAAGARAGAVIVDHGLQAGSAEVAARAAEAAAGLGLDPVLVRAVTVGASLPGSAGAGGPEALAREARYAAFARAVAETGAVAVLTAHTRDDQAEQVLLALARGSGARSLAGIPQSRPLEGAEGAVVLRPFLGERPAITRKTTLAVCAELGLEPWRDPHNSDPAYTRVRVRETVLPLLERQLGPGIAAALARTADIAAEDAAVLDACAVALVEEAVEHGETPLAAAVGRDPSPASRSAAEPPPRLSVPVAALAGQPAAVRHRAIRLIASRGFGAHLAREHVLAVAVLVTDWRGQGPVHVPGVRVRRAAGSLVFEAQLGSPRGPSRPGAAEQ